MMDMASYDHYDEFQVENGEASAFVCAMASCGWGAVRAFWRSILTVWSRRMGGLVYIVSATVNNQSIYGFRNPQGDSPMPIPSCCGTTSRCSRSSLHRLAAATLRVCRGVGG